MFGDRSVQVQYCHADCTDMELFLADGTVTRTLHVQKLEKNARHHPREEAEVFYRHISCHFKVSHPDALVAFALQRSLLTECANQCWACRQGDSQNHFALQDTLGCNCMYGLLDPAGARHPARLVGAKATPKRLTALREPLPECYHGMAEALREALDISLERDILEGCPCWCHPMPSGDGDGEALAGSPGPGQGVARGSGSGRGPCQCHTTSSGDGDGQALAGSPGPGQGVARGSGSGRGCMAGGGLGRGGGPAAKQGGGEGEGVPPAEEEAAGGITYTYTSGR